MLLKAFGIRPDAKVYNCAASVHLTLDVCDRLLAQTLSNLQLSSAGEEEDSRAAAT